MDVWTVIRKNGTKLTWWGTWKAKALHRFPKVDKNGFVHLDAERPYVVNPELFVREYYRPRKYLGLVEKVDTIQYWKENEPDPISFYVDSLTPGSIGITGDTIRQYAKSEHLRRLVQPETNFLLILLIAGLAAIAAGAVGYIMGLRG